MSVFVLDSKTKEGDKIVLQRVSFEISRERQGLLLQSRFCQGSVELLKNVSSKTGLGSAWLVRCENENCQSQITNDPFSTTERIEQSRVFE